MTAETRRHRWPRVMAGVLSVLVLLATGAAAAGNYLTTQVLSNVSGGNDGNFQGATNTPVPGAPMNILLMGSDTREGKNAKGHGNVADIAGARSDTTILLHISGDRTRALAVSIPRDTKMMLPTCKATGGGTKGGYVSRFNEAFDYGGPGCTVRAVEGLSGLTIDHYVVVDFTGFKDVVNALDGVDVCLKKDVHDKDAKLDLTAGNHTVRGEQALAFVRARKQVGDGSDLSRIERQQEFLSSAIKKATSVGVITNPAQLLSVLSATAKSLTTDPSLANPDALKDLALNMTGIKPSDITFATLPWKYNDDFATVSVIPSQAAELWRAIATDQAWPPAPTDGTDGQPLTAAPTEITANFQNVSGATGEALKASDLLKSENYKVGTVTNGKTTGSSAILYNPNIPAQVEAARTLGYATGIPTAATSKAKGTAVVVQVGADFPTTVKPVVASAKQSAAAETAKPRTAAQSICSK